MTKNQGCSFGVPKDSIVKLHKKRVEEAKCGRGEEREKMLKILLSLGLFLCKSKFFKSIVLSSNVGRLEKFQLFKNKWYHPTLTPPNMSLLITQKYKPALFTFKVQENDLTVMSNNALTPPVQALSSPFVSKQSNKQNKLDTLYQKVK